MPKNPVLEVSVPAESAVAHAYPTTDLADAYAIALPAGASTDPDVLARFVLSHMPRWVAPLMALRDAMVAGFGLKTARQLHAAGGARIYLFRVYQTLPHEIVMGEDDRHLNFRLSVLQRQAGTAGGAAQLVVSTVVQCRNRLGRNYLRLIAPFHRRIIRATLRRAGRAEWPLAVKG